MIEKILFLIERRKVKPSEITAVTFTNKAAQEMRSRLEKELGNKKTLRQLQIGTFHSICLDILKEQGEKFSLADEIQVKELAQETIDTWNMKISLKTFFPAFPCISLRQRKESFRMRPGRKLLTIIRNF